ncbi:RNA 2',3'-cyclic phosphodiesterase [Halomonas sp. KAO]|uniref:RNA 2',3'-cyclic phosphodiesterase n=1 Tax=unclassified Halomonas TaxID=2609666 RepID=UPI00189D8BBB|nr:MULTISPECIES: RNA 2',3'-cyclic phosphodiesterase [unclassified Halomonas]MBF7053613.1 RNA 2',3'-cyclic phosphodiesterase [Halomonas sp. KAO]MDT0500892.1 RNA 2',3'-cyclic phosphodiesterase [Halomonas sp. PAR7]MDT0512628.1 RNA 2',3'-cyclic phosphodiesterase [Halomonas sp. LES1]MDT0592790.1 RNA 2',3'-cyclic phosphodiesterase [Halomonas sp. PAR8]
MRLFLALEPPDDLRERLATLADLAQARCGGRRVPDASLHLTLAFLGEVDEARLPALVEWVSGQAPTGGVWRLDRWGSFRRPGIVWVGGRTPDPALDALQASLWDDLEPLDLSGRPTHFVPHITLLRRAERMAIEPLEAQAPVALDWRWQRLTLLRSYTEQDGARYEALAHSA